MKMKPVTTRKPWTNDDVDQLLRVYNVFLTAQLQGDAYTKASAVRDLAALQGRSKGSIECKMMNVSAVLQMHGLDWVKGYKPLSNINRELVSQVCAFFDIRSEVA